LRGQRGSNAIGYRGVDFVPSHRCAIDRNPWAVEIDRIARCDGF
jgi:hypothetical protein